MPKEKKNAARQSRNPNSGFVLDRRSRSSGKNAGSSNVEIYNDVRPLSVDAFIEVLNRYCRRFLKDQKNFSLASLRILEYDRVKATAGDELAQQLDRLGANLVSCSLRAEDRICLVAPSQYLVLMPGTVYDDAYNAMDRAAASIAEQSLREKNLVVRPSAQFLIASSSTSSSSSKGPGVDGESMIVSTEYLLNCVGYAIGSHGRLIDRNAQQCTDGGAKCALFAAPRESWFERYTIAGDRMTDTWSDAADEVELRVLNARPGSTENGVSNDAMLARLRALQSIDHPAFNKITDFYVASDWTVSLISTRVNGLELTACHNDTKAQLAEILGDNAESVVLNWAMQICTAFIAAQAMTPPMVLRSFSNLKLTLSQKERVVISDYEEEYLRLSQLHDSSPSGKTDNFIPEMARFLSSLLNLKGPSERSHTSEFAGLLQALAAGAAMPERSSLYKLRSTLKAFSEAST